ncbi:hypothetical protein BH23BAC1_BH23BAC1_13220 [soil metagenome]
MKKEAKTKDGIHRLYRLDELNDYKVSDKDTDVRGFILIGGDGERIGKVQELIVDPEIGKVRYLDVKLDSDLIVIDEKQHILLPIGVARLDDENNNIIVKNLNRSNVKFYPVYKGEPITREYEQALRESHRFTLLNSHSTSGSTTFHDHGSNLSPENTAESGSETGNKNKEFSPASSTFHNEDKDQLIAEIEVLKKERDIARAERDILKVQLEQARKGVKDDFYDHEDFDADKFYENKKRKRE